MQIEGTVERENARPISSRVIVTNRRYNKGKSTVEDIETQVFLSKNNFKNVDIGRPGPFGNPFPLGKRDSRILLLKKYSDWVNTLPANHELHSHVFDLAKRVVDGENINLVCWCAPQKCHGDVLKVWIIELAEQLLAKRKAGVEDV